MKRLSSSRALALASMAVMSARGTITSEIFRSVKAMRLDIIEAGFGLAVALDYAVWCPRRTFPGASAVASRDGEISDFNLDHRPDCTSGVRGEP